MPYLASLVSALEAQISDLEKEQSERQELLSDADFFKLPESTELIRAYQDDVAKLERLTAKWEQTLEALEAKTAEVEAAEAQLQAD